MRMPVLLPAAAVILLGGATIKAENWPDFRGPTGQGIVANGKLPVEWSATKNVAWKQPIPGKAWSSPIIQDGRIYLTTAVFEENSGKKELSLRTLCLEAASGKVRWDHEVFQYDAAKAPNI